MDNMINLIITRGAIIMNRVPELVFNAFNGQYLKVSIGKGLITLQEIAELLERYSVFFA